MAPPSILRYVSGEKYSTEGHIFQQMGGVQWKLEPRRIDYHFTGESYTDISTESRVRFMCSIKKVRKARLFLVILLAALFLFELHTVLVSFDLMEDIPHHDLFVLRSPSADLLRPIRIPEKVALHEEVSQDWEQLNKRDSKQITFLLIFCILFSFLLLSRTTVLHRIPESTNLPHSRVLRFIHLKDGKGPEKTILLK